MTGMSRREVLGYLGAAGLAASVATVTSQPTAATVIDKTGQRIMQNGILRCGYNTSPPWFSFDANRKPVGVFYDIMEALGQVLSLKIEWAEEISLADFPAALEAGRIDVYAFPVAPTAQRARGADFLDTLVAVPFCVSSRKNMPLQGNWHRLNNKSVTISSLEGAMNDRLAKKFFPQSNPLTLPQTSAFSDIFLNVAAGKADIVIQDVISTRNFIRNNPNTIEIAQDIPAVVILPWTVALKKNEFTLKQMLNTAIADLQTMGEIHAIHQKHGIYEDGAITAEPAFGNTIAWERSA